MHGIVNRGLQLFLIEEYGEDFWRELAVRLDQESGFEALLLYDDEVTRGLMSAAARRLNCTRAEIWEGFGAFLTRSDHTASFWALLRFGGPDFASFLVSLEDVPAQIQLALPDFYLPPLKVLQPCPGRFELHCGAGLWGLGSIATGLLPGRGARLPDRGAGGAAKHKCSNGGGLCHSAADCAPELGATGGGGGASCLI
ncbi:heme NO-binding domain-containing protein [bacterium]|nr:heme NO-binding domain-containing protein [bacterium]